MIRPIFVSLVILIASSPTAFAKSKGESPEIDKETVKVMSEHRPAVLECYKHFLDEGTEEKGVVVLKWKVNDQGKAQDAEVDTKQTTLKNKVLHDCLLDLVKSLTFPEAEQGKTKKSFYRFTFQ